MIARTLNADTSKNILQDPSSHRPHLAKASLRRTLVPNESVRDIPAWASSNYFRSWLRRAWLVDRFGSTKRMHEAASFMYGLEPGRLPRLQDVTDAFDMSSWHRSKRRPPAPPSPPPRSSSSKSSSSPSAMTTSDLGLAEILELGGCAVQGRNEFNVFCEANGVWELFTADFADGLSQYIERRSQALDVARGRPLRVLEVGAGSGTLANALRARLPRDRVEIVACDTFSWPAATWPSQSETAASPAVAVARMDALSGLARWEPDVVLCAWMPMGVDWSAAMRSTPSVKEYILVGEIDDGCCGDPWLTWGRRAAGERRESADNCEPSPYTQDKFQRVDDPDGLSKFQLGRYDGKFYARNSRTTAFRRRPERQA